VHVESEDIVECLRYPDFLALNHAPGGRVWGRVWYVTASFGGSLPHFLSVKPWGKGLVSPHLLRLPDANLRISVRSAKSYARDHG
jgi:hypothetical protein